MAGGSGAVWPQRLQLGPEACMVRKEGQEATGGVEAAALCGRRQ